MSATKTIVCMYCPAQKAMCVPRNAMPELWWCEGCARRLRADRCAARPGVRQRLMLLVAPLTTIESRGLFAHFV